MLQFYLLLRLIRLLGLRYKQEIEDSILKRQVAVVREPLAKTLLWAPVWEIQKRSLISKSDSRSLKLAKMTVSLTQVTGNKELGSVTPDVVNEMDQESVHPADLNYHFIHIFAKELNQGYPGAKVRGYLLSSIHDSYDYAVDYFGN
ncbi:hypothetical protein RhiLY_08876 [Ceratobasidium sp. AG-Ba]|nr:hypothetical protein RhiLY_08876 [Ceratobasidium sp. AG-Ba]